MQIFTLKRSLALIAMSFSLGLAYAQTMVNVEKAGELSQKIKDAEKNTITELKVNGNIDGKDILFLREMAGRDKNGKETAGKLASLDLSEANIVSGGDNYYIVKRGLSTKYYKPTENDVVCPYMFYKCGALTKVVLPQSAKEIGQYAFSGCAALTMVNIPENVENIREYAFSDCKALTSVGEISAKVAEIGTKAFYNTAIKAFSVAEDNEDFASDNGVLYSGDKITLLFYPTGSMDESFEISPECTNIGANAFAYASHLKTITLPDDISTIEASAFEKSGLKTMVAKASTISIAKSAFADCQDLETIKFEGNVGIDQDGFKNCFKLTAVYLRGQSVPECQQNVFTPGKKLLKIFVDAKILEQCKAYFTEHNVVKGNKNYDILDIATDGIERVKMGVNVEEMKHYTLDGRSCDANSKGIHIVKLSDGKVIKKVVK